MQPAFKLTSHFSLI